MDQSQTNNEAQRKKEWDEWIAFNKRLNERQIQSGITPSQEFVIPQNESLRKNISLPTSPPAILEQNVFNTRLGNLTEETIRARTQKGDTPLHRAAKTGRISEIPRHLLTTELFMVMNYSFHPETPLHLAAGHGNLDKVPKEFLTKETMTASSEYERKESKTGPTPPRTATPLHIAALCGHANQIPKEFLTPEFLSIEATGYRRTVLHYFAFGRSLHLIPEIYANSGIWNLKDSRGQTPQNILEEIIEREAYVARVRAEPATEKQKKKLRYFGCTFDENISKGLASDALDVCVRDLPKENRDSSNDSATEDQTATLWTYDAKEMDEFGASHMPATVPAPAQKPKKQKRAWTTLSKLTEETIRARTKSGDTALHVAAKTGRIREIPIHLLQTELFLVRNYDQQNKPHRTPLHIAAAYGFLDQIPSEFLTEETLAILDKYGRTPLQEAAISGNVATIPVGFLTAEFLSSIPAKFEGNTILHYLAFRNQLSELPSNCITPEMLNLKNYNGVTPKQILEKDWSKCEKSKRHDELKKNALYLHVHRLVYYRGEVCPHLTIGRVKEAAKALDIIAPGWMEEKNCEELLLQKAAELNPEWAVKERWL